MFRVIWIVVTLFVFLGVNDTPVGAMNSTPPPPPMSPDKRVSLAPTPSAVLTPSVTVEGVVPIGIITHHGPGTSVGMFLADGTPIANVAPGRYLIREDGRDAFIQKDERGNVFPVVIGLQGRYTGGSGPMYRVVATNVEAVEGAVQNFGIASVVSEPQLAGLSVKRCSTRETDGLFSFEVTVADTGMVITLVTALPAPGHVLAQGRVVPDDRFVLRWEPIREDEK